MLWWALDGTAVFETLETFLLFLLVTPVKLTGSLSWASTVSLLWWIMDSLSGLDICSWLSRNSVIQQQRPSAENCTASQAEQGRVE